MKINHFTIYDELRAAGLQGKVVGFRGDDLIYAEGISDADRAAVDAVVAAHDPDAPSRPVLTGAALLDVLSDAEASTLKIRDIGRLSARGTDVLAPTNAKISRLIGKNPGLTYEQLVARLTT